ncbi:MAG TPA: hypothetical protein VMR46_01575 [Candidatus Paceibacterota bacterium]|nr:hypothetical protein [Candidatus Paceibacterota bacterium]
MKVRELSHSIQPLVRQEFVVPNSHITFTAACFEGDGWSLKPLQEMGDEKKHPEFAAQVGSALAGLDVRHAYAPNPTAFNAKIIKPGNLQNIIPLPGGVFLCRNRSFPADGTVLSVSGDAGVFSAGGCGIVVMSYGRELAFAHAGRDCILDRTWIETRGRERGRDRISVVDTMLDFLDVPVAHMDRVRAWPLFFIKPRDFIHRVDDKNEKHRSFNYGAVYMLPMHYGNWGGLVTNKGGPSEQIAINLPGIVFAQLRKRGVPEANINMEHSFVDDELPHTRNGDGRGRYLVAIVRQ